MTTSLKDAVVDLLPGSWANVGLLLVTVAAYWMARWLYLRSRSNPLLIPVLTAVVLIVTILVTFNIPYEQYAQSTRLLQLLIGPATVALAVPLYTHLEQLKRMWIPLVTALLAGGITAIVSALLIVWVFGGSVELLLSLAPKSATMPVSIPASVAVGGVASLVAVSTAITGIVGVLIASPLFRWIGVKDPVVQGFTLGLTSHAIGTARSIQINSEAGGSAALAMGLNGLLTAALMPFLPYVLAWWQLG